MTMPRGYKRDAHTGRPRPKHKISNKAKLADRKRRGHHMKAATKLKIMRGIKRELRTGRNKFGRRIIRKRAHH